MQQALEYTKQEQTLNFSSVHDILNTSDAKDKYYNLPKHRKCCSNGLSLIAAKDSNKIAEEHLGYKKECTSLPC